MPRVNRSAANGGDTNNSSPRPAAGEPTIRHAWFETFRRVLGASGRDRKIETQTARSWNATAYGSRGRALGRRRKHTFTLRCEEWRSESWNSTRSFIDTSSPATAWGNGLCRFEPIRIKTFACIMPKASSRRFPFPMWRVLSQFVLSLCAA